MSVCLVILNTYRTQINFPNDPERSAPTRLFLGVFWNDVSSVALQKLTKPLQMMVFEAWPWQHQGTLSLNKTENELKPMGRAAEEWLVLLSTRN